MRDEPCTNDFEQAKRIICGEDRTICGEQAQRIILDELDDEIADAALRVGMSFDTLKALAVQLCEAAQRTADLVNVYDEKIRSCLREVADEERAAREERKPTPAQLHRAAQRSASMGRRQSRRARSNRQGTNYRRRRGHSRAHGSW